jgi:hypothetical protein
MTFTKKTTFLFSGILIFIFLNTPLFADKLDAEINRARTKTGKLIKCSPYGKVPGTISLEEAGKKLRSGMILQMLPGYYNPMDLIIFDQDKIIIEGDGSGGHVDVPIILYGRNCIIRNIRARSVEGESMTMVDTVTHYLTITSGNKRGKTIIANSAFNWLRIYPNAQNITIKNCTLVNGEKVKDEGKILQRAIYTTHKRNVYTSVAFGEMVKKGKIDILDSIFYTEGHLFGSDRKLLSLFLQDNIFHVGRSLVTAKIGKTGVKSISGMKEHFELKTKGKNDLGKPIFVKAPNENHHWDWARDNFILTPKSPGYGKNIGVCMGPKGVPVPPNSPELKNKK